MFFESKWDIYQLLPQNLFPKTVLIKNTFEEAEMLSIFETSGFTFPVIAKPDRGERGFGVKKIYNSKELIDYKQFNPIDFLIQDCINFPIELSVFYYRFPEQEKGIISSVTFKEMLSVVGDGVSTVADLVRKNPRAILQLSVLEKTQKNLLDKLPALGEKIELVPFGNHSRGAMFLDYNHIIDEKLTQQFDTISHQINGFFYGRYDLKCTTIEDLKEGNFFSILELNGVGAEPAHIYQPGFSFWKAQKVIFHHFNIMQKIAAIQHKKGIPYLSLKSFIALQIQQKNYKAKVTSWY